MALAQDEVLQANALFGSRHHLRLPWLPYLQAIVHLTSARQTTRHAEDMRLHEERLIGAGVDANRGSTFCLIPRTISQNRVHNEVPQSP